VAVTGYRAFKGEDLKNKVLRSSNSCCDQNSFKYTLEFRGVIFRDEGAHSRIIKKLSGVNTEC